MRTGECEIGVGSMIKLPEAPAVRVVAGTALFAKLRLVHVARPVTADALMRRIAICPCRMTFFAGNADMQADKRKSCEVVVKLHAVAPTAFLVARLAVAPQRFLVHVIDAMTAGAIRWHFLLLEYVRMTTMAIELFMCSAKRKLGALLVVERRDFPFVLGVAVDAGCSESARVDVRCRVTATAFIRHGCLQVAASMTGIASQLGVAAKQCVTAYFQVVETRLLPAFNAVAAGAIRTPGSPVHVIG